MPFGREGSRWLLPGLLAWASFPMPASAETCCPILELRQYTLHPRQRDALMQKQQELQRQIAQTNQAIERMKMDLRAAEEAAKKR